MKKIQNKPIVDLPSLSRDSNNYSDDEKLMIELDETIDNKEKYYSTNNVPKEIKCLIDRMDKKVCNICLDEGEEEDDIFQCSNCFYSTHRWCYGSELIKDYPNYTKWTCQKCDFIMKNPHIFDQINCIFCPFKVGIMKKITENEWAHLVCVNWDENIHFINEIKEEINYEDINKEKFTLTCMFCKIRQGACIQCDVPSCSKSFHVICAIQKGLIKHWKTMESDNSNKDKINIYCQHHNQTTNQKIKKNDKNSGIVTAKKSVDKSYRLDMTKKEEKDKFISKNEMIFRKNKEKISDYRLDDCKNSPKQIIIEENPKKENGYKKNSIQEIVDLTDNIEDDSQYLNKKVERCNEKYLLNPELGRLMGIYYPIKYHDLIAELDKYLKNNNLIDKQNQFINVHKNEKLKKIFECERISYNVLISKLDNFLKKADYNKEINDKSKKKDELKVTTTKKKIFENKNVVSESVKFNINCNTNSKIIHSNDIIKKRGFFVKENALKLFKF